MASFPLRQIKDVNNVLELLEKKNTLVAKLVEFEIRSGLRFVDITKLTFDDVMINGTVKSAFTVVQSKSFNIRVKRMPESMAKTLSKITIYVNDEFKDLIWSIHEINGSNKLLFNSQSHLAKPNTAISIQYVNRLLKQVAHELSLDFSLSTHSMRKTFALFLMDQGASMKVLMEALGHANITATQYYLNTFNDEKEVFTSRISLR